MRFKNTLVAMALIGISASVYARQSAPPSPAAILLRERTALKLSNAQVKRLEELDRGYTTAARPVEERMIATRAADRRLRARSKELTPAERQQLSRDSVALRQDASTLATLRRENREAALKVLTPTQRTKAEELLKERLRERHRPGTRGTKKPSHPKGGAIGSLLDLMPR